MAAKVVDASAMVAYLFGEPEGVAMGERLEGGVLFAPPLLHLEVANVCLRKARRHPQLRDALWAALREAEHLDIQVLEVDHLAVLDLAEKTQLTAYDAAYLWMALELDAEVVTLDQALEAASRSKSWH